MLIPSSCQTYLVFDADAEAQADALRLEEQNAAPYFHDMNENVSCMSYLDPEAMKDANHMQCASFQEKSYAFQILTTSD